MKIVLLYLFIFSTTLFSENIVNNKKIDKDKKERIEKQIKTEIKREKEYSQKQTFYIDLKGAEINEESLKDVPKLEVDDLDMDSVYD